MSRGLSTSNTSEVNSAHIHEVVLVKLEFDTPVYVHSGIGTIVYDSNTYVGVGQFGGISAPRESALLGPASVQLTLGGITADHITEALDSGNLYDAVTIYQGYRQDDGTLVDDPWIVWKGWYEYADIEIAEESKVVINCQHDLSQLDEKAGDRYSHEDQQSKFAGDDGFEFTHDISSRSRSIIWGGGPVPGGVRAGSGGSGDRPPRQKY